MMRLLVLFMTALLAASGSAHAAAGGPCYTWLNANWPASGTTAAKLTTVNALTAAGPAVPLIIPTYRIYNAIVPAEFVALTAANQQLVRDVLAMGTVDASAGTNVRAVLLAKFPSGTATFTALSALAASFDTPQVPAWQANSCSQAIGTADLTLAGGLN